MDLELGGKVVLVTGGSDGLGAAVARRLVREGSRVALCARGAERLESTAAARPFAEVDDAAWEADLQLKLFAAVRTSRRVLPLLREAGGGSIVNVLAVGAKAPGANSMPSSVSRAAGMALTKALSKELGPAGIRVNAVLVGLIESGQWERQAAAAGQPVEALYTKLAKNAAIPLGRVGKAEEFADVVAFLLSPRAGYVSGTALNVDGGLSPAV